LAIVAKKIPEGYLTGLLVDEEIVIKKLADMHQKSIMSIVSMQANPREMGFGKFQWRDSLHAPEYRMDTLSLGFCQLR